MDIDLTCTRMHTIYHQNPSILYGEANHLFISSNQVDLVSMDGKMYGGDITCSIHPVT